MAMADHTIPLFHGGHDVDDDDDEGDDDGDYCDNYLLHDYKNGVSKPKGHGCVCSNMCC